MASSITSEEKRRRRNVWRVFNCIGYTLFIIPFSWLGIYLGQPTFHLFQDGASWLTEQEFRWYLQEDGLYRANFEIDYHFSLWVPSLAGIYLKSVEYSMALIIPQHNVTSPDYEMSTDSFSQNRVNGGQLCSGNSTDVLLNSEISVPNSFGERSSLETCLGMKVHNLTEDFDYTDGAASALLMNSTDYGAYNLRLPRLFANQQSYWQFLLQLHFQAAETDLLYKYSQYSCKKMGSVSWALAVYNMRERHLVPLVKSSLSSCAVVVQVCGVTTTAPTTAPTETTSPASSAPLETTVR